MISGNWVRGVAEEPYLDYMVAQVKQVAKEAEAGQTIEVTYSNITTHVDSWQPSEAGKGTADVMVKPTRYVTGKRGASVADTASRRCSLQRHVAYNDKPGDAAWWTC